MSRSDEVLRPGRNLALELVRVTEAAALAAATMVGRGDKEGADQAAVDAMRYVLDGVPGLSITPRNSVNVRAVNAVTAVNSPRGQDSAWPRTMM